MSRPPRKRVDLRALPVGLQYIIALTTVAAVVAAAWWVGRDDPVPTWITRYLVPILGWTYLALLVFLILHRLVRGKKPRSPSDGRAE